MGRVSEMKIENEHVFRDVDTSGVAPELIAYLEAVAALPEVRRLHEVASAILAAKPGERVLEVGCGLGADARELAAAVRPGGSVTAIDVSQAMIAAATDRHDPSLDVTYERADVTSLPYDDGAFDVVRIERVLQHVADPAVACREMARVLAPGGRLLATDTDWGSLAVALLPEDEDVKQRCLAHLRTRFIQARAGLDLRRLLTEAGLEVTSVTPHAFAYTDLATAAIPLPMLNESIPPEADMVPREDRDEWLAALHRADEAKAFVAGWTGYSALAVRPA